MRLGQRLRFVRTEAAHGSIRILADDFGDSAIGMPFLANRAGWRPLGLFQRETEPACDMVTEHHRM